MQADAATPEHVAEERPHRGSKGALLIIFVTVFIDLLGFGIVLPLLPRYADALQASDVTLALLMSSFSAMQFLCAPVWGRISDRVGRRPVLIMGLTGSALFYSLFGWATQLGTEGEFLGLGAIPWMFVCRIGAGVAGATISTAQAYIADVTSPEKRARGMALIGAAFGIGFTFGPLLGAGFVSAELSDPETLVAASASSAALKLTPADRDRLQPLLQDYETRLKDRHVRLDRRQRRALRKETEQQMLARLSPEQVDRWRQLSAPSPAPGYVAGVLSGLALLSAIMFLPESLRAGSIAERHWLDVKRLRQAAMRPLIGLILLVIFLTTFAFAQFESTLSLLTASLDLPDRYNYYVFAYVGLTLALSQGLFVRRVAPRWGEFVLSVLGTSLMTAGLLLVGVAASLESRPMLYAVLPISVIGFACLTPSLQSLLSRSSPADDQGGMLGLGQSMSALARILGPMAGIPLIYRELTYPYWSAAGLMALGLLLTLLLPRKPTDFAQPVDPHAPAAPA